MTDITTMPRIVFRMGKRIYLRPVLKEDLPSMTLWINDSEISQNLTTVYPMSPDDEEKWFSQISEKKGKNVLLAIVLKENDEIIGTMGFTDIDHRNGTAETGAMIGNKDYWDKGYGTEAKMLVLQYAFNTLNLRKINSRVYRTNPRSKRALEKAGYVEEGCMKKEVYINGEYVDLFLMAVFKERFAELWDEYKAKYLD
jgi:RimJ/RimL family protein N-acetyltransferase